MVISDSDDAMVRDIILGNRYKKFIENKKLMMDWLNHMPTGKKPIDTPNDVWIPFLFFVRKSAYMTMFDVAYTWFGHDKFKKKIYELIDMDEIYQHEMLYMTNNNMIT